MAQVPLSPPPPSNEPILDRWLYLLWKRLNQAGQILWNTIDKTGSNLTDLQTRNHADLQNINTASYTHLTSTQATDLTDGGATTLHKHSHNSQDGIQGGTTNEYYHSTAAEYTGTGTGVFVRTQSPTISDPTINSIDFTTNTTIASAIGRMTWNQDDGTLNLGMGFDGVTQQIGLETYFHVKNQTGVTLLNGRVVRAVGTLGNSGLILADYAIADNTHLSRYVLGVLTMDIATGEDGFVTSFGAVREIDTTGTPFGEVWADGDVLYVSPTTSGYLTKVEPDAPDQKIVVAIVVHAHASGSIFVRPTFGQLLHDCHDVTNTPPLNNEALTWDATAGYWKPKNPLEVVGEITYETTGFQNAVTGYPTGTTLAWDDATRTVTLSPTGADFSFWIRGKQYTKSVAQTSQIANTTGIHFIYFDANGNFTNSTSVWNLLTVAPVCAVYWNATTGKGIPYEERHGIVMDGATHQYLHSTRGTQYISGAAIAGYTVAPAVPADANNTFSISSAVVSDEDLRSTLTAVSDGGPYTVAYRTGAAGEWTWDATPVVPYLTSGAEFGVNLFSGGVWGLSPLTGNNYANTYIVGVPSITAGYQFLIIPGQTIYATLAEAQSESFSTLSTGELPFAENVILWQVTYQRGAGYGTTGKVRIAATPVRIIGNASIISTGVNVHNNLSGIQGGAAGDYFHLTGTQATDLTDAGDSTLHYHASDRDRANHTGTQVAATISDFDTEVSNNTDVAANTAARHVAVTVADSTSVDLTLSGQQISAVVLPAGVSHSALADLNSTSYYHLTQTNHTDLTDGGDSTLHYHASDRALANATGTLGIGNGGTGQTTATAAFDALAPTTTQGDLIYFNGTDNVRLPKGTASQVLTMNSGATAPEWQTPSGGSGGAISNVIASPTTIAADTSYLTVGYLSVTSDLTIEGNVGVF